MKKIALFLALCLIVLPISALAAQVELGRLSLRLPASLDVFTQNMPPDDPLPAIYGTTAGQVAQELASQGCLMRAREIAGAYAIALFAQPQSGADFSALSDEELMALSAALSSEQPASSPVLRSRQAAFLIFRGGSSLTAFTRVDGTLYRLALTAGGRLTSGMADVLRKAAGSMDFGRGQ